VPTVAELLAEALPPGSGIRAGAGGLTRDVTWAVAVRPYGAGLSLLRGGELALLSFTALTARPSPLADQVIAGLAAGGVAAAAFVGPRHHLAEAVATAAELPLIELPAGHSLREVESAANRFLAERRHDAHAAAHGLYAELTRLALDGSPPAQILRRLAERSGRWCALLGPDGALRSAVSPGLRSLIVDGTTWPEQPSKNGDEPPFEPPAGALEMAVGPLLAWVDRFRELPAEPPVYTVPLAGAGAALLFAPLIHSEQLDGFLVLHAPDTLREADTLTTTRGASACAVALSRGQAAAEAADQLRGEFLTELRDAEAREEMVLARARRLGYALERPHMPLALAPAETNRVRGSVARLSRDALAPVGAGPVATLVLLPFDPPLGRPADAEGRRQASRLQAVVAESAERPSVGLGRIGAGLPQLRRGLDEAEQALGLGRRLFGPGRVTHIADLGVHQLLAPLAAGGGLAPFRAEHLGTLEAYDRENGTDLIGTLRTFFAARSSPTLAAKQLHLHRNSLLYRLQRIRELTGLDFEDPETRLALEVALRARDLLDAHRA
jgi:purine catabolism regulator